MFGTGLEVCDALDRYVRFYLKEIEKSQFGIVFVSGTINIRCTT